MRQPFVVAGWWAALLAVYLLLASNVTLGEVAVGGVAGLVATLAITAVRAQSGARFAMKAAWWRPLATLPLRALSDSLLVLRAICRRPFRQRGSGRFAEREFNPGNDHALSKTRCALVTAAISFAPNSFVLGVDCDRRRLLIHELVPQREAARDQDWPL
ncbi:MAG: Na+/H+ antiporter subunit E [Chthoniobacterales bacterium]